MKTIDIVTRLDLAITVMQRAAKTSSIYMPRWQDAPNRMHVRYTNTEQKLHSCGNTACFAGYLALSQEFRELGLSPELSGAPVHVTAACNYVREGAIASVLGITLEEADNLVLGKVRDVRGRQYSFYYGRFFEDVTAEDVIGKLLELKDKYTLLVGQEITKE